MNNPLSFSDPARTLKKLLLATILIFVFWRLREVFLLTFFAILLGIIFNFPVNFLARKLPRLLAVILLGMTLILAGAGIGLALAPVTLRQSRIMLEAIPDAFDRLQNWLDRFSLREEIPRAHEISATLREQVSDFISTAISKIPFTAITLMEVITLSFLAVFLALFLSYEPKSYLSGMLWLAPSRYREHLQNLWDQVGSDLRHWLRGILISMFLMGGLTALFLYLAGIEGWFILALITFLGTFIPYAGAIASAIPGLIVGLAQGPSKFFLACAVYLGVHLVEGYLVEPIVMKKVVELKPAVLLLGQLMMAVLFGALGVIVATPLLVCLKTFSFYLISLSPEHKELKAAPENQGGYGQGHQPYHQ